jgi:hypothetical protein
MGRLFILPDKEEVRGSNPGAPTSHLQGSVILVLSPWRPVVAEMPPVRPFGSGRTHCWSANDDAWSRKRGKLSLTLLSQLASQPPPSCNLFVSACCRHENDTFAGRRRHFCQGPAARGAAADLLRRAGHGGLTGSPDSKTPARRIAIV